jgi:hypothetical protein
MKQFAYAFIIACASLSCSGKGQLDFFRGPLQSVATVAYNGSYEVQLNPVYSTGPIVKWQWAIDPTSPTKDSLFAPAMQNNSEPYPTVQQVHNPGLYIFNLSVYDRAGNISSDTVSLNVP